MKNNSRERKSNKDKTRKNKKNKSVDVYALGQFGYLSKKQQKTQRRTSKN